jgi:FkbM family methyltransferase
MIVRRLLFSLLGFQRYLRVISWVFLKTYLLGIKLRDHQQVRFLGTLLKPGDVCIDIGANLGYFSIPMSHWVGRKGKVYSVEPVPAFREVLAGNVERFALGNVEIMPYALGDADGVAVKLATPRVDGVVRHGRTEVMSSGHSGEVAEVHESLMYTPSHLFSGLAQLNFIKCDVEGYEMHIIPHLVSIIQQFKPILEIEIASEGNRRQITGIMQELGYRCFILQNGALVPYSAGKEEHLKEIEFYFIYQ